MNSNPVTRLSHLVCLGFGAFALSFASPCHAQEIDSPKFVAFAGAGALTTSTHSLEEMQAGIGFKESAPNKWIGFGFESGYLGPWSDL